MWFIIDRKQAGEQCDENSGGIKTGITAAGATAGRNRKFENWTNSGK
ncbi:MAG: hypothetical protein PUA72_12055 [Lachnospiraceae bacterium]|nr:hypothetical protein [Lachnospiraceae bacterium]